MCDYGRRRDLGEATGPTEAEFATGGATILVGRLGNYEAFRPGLPSTPWDDQLSHFAQGSIDALPQLVGSLAGALFRREEGNDTDLRVERRMAVDRVARRLSRKAAASYAAASALTRWFTANEGDIVEAPQGGPAFWVAPGKGYGFVFRGDDFVVQHVRHKARNIARDPRYGVHFALVATPTPEQYLVAFLADPKYVPATYETAVDLANAVAENPAAAQVDESNPDEIAVTPTPDAAEAAGVDGGVAVGNFFRNTFGPKKPEGIQKKIEKLEQQLSYWKEKLQEAEAKAEGFQVGYVPTYANRQLHRFGLLGLLNAAGQNPSTMSYVGPVIVDRLDGLGVGMIPESLEYGLARGDLLGSVADMESEYADRLSDGTLLGSVAQMERDTEYGLEDGNLLGAVSDLDDFAEDFYDGTLLGAVQDVYAQAYQAGQISAGEFQQAQAIVGQLDDGELEAEAGELGIEVGRFVGRAINRGGGRRVARRQRRRNRRLARIAAKIARRRAKGRAVRRLLRRQSRLAPVPQVIVIRRGGEEYADDQGDDQGYDDGGDYDEEGAEGLTVVGVLPDWDPEGPMTDVPYWNGQGAVAEYPVGGLER